MEYALAPFRRYFQFSGRARRREYWLFLLLVWVVGLILGYVETTLGLGGSYQQQIIQATGYEAYSGAYLGGPLTGLWTLFVLIPGLAVLVRRLHDTDRSAFWLFLYLLPLIGAIIMLIFTLLPGTPGPNSYGPDPKGEGVI